MKFVAAAFGGVRGARARALTYGPILAHNLPADATNTKRLYFPLLPLEAEVVRVGLRQPSADGRREQSPLTSRVASATTD